MSVESQMGELSTKLALELIPKALAGTGIPEPITRIVLETLIGALQEEQNKTDARLSRLVGSCYQSGTDYLADARRLQGERREQWIKSALGQFVTASHVEDTLLAAKSQFFVGVCYDLLSESPLAREWYERAYRSASQLATQARRRPQELEQLQQFVSSLTQVLRAHGSTLSLSQPMMIGGKPKTKEQWKEEGLSHYDAGQYQEAIADYGCALQLDPKYVIAYINRGFTYDALQQYQKAIADYDHALQLDPRHAIAYSNRGSTYYALQQYQKAIADYGRALQFDPKNTAFCTNRGIAYNALQQYQEAIADFDRALQLDPNHRIAKTNRELAYLKLKRRSLQN